MIEIDKTPRFKTADGALHGSIEEAQIHAIGTILVGLTYEMAADVLKNSDAIIAILKMKPRKQRAAKTKPKKVGVVK